MVAMSFGLLFLLVPSNAMAAERSLAIPPLSCGTLASPGISEWAFEKGHSMLDTETIETNSPNWVACYLSEGSDYISFYSYHYFPESELTQARTEIARMTVLETQTPIGKVLTVAGDHDGPPTYYFLLEENGYFFRAGASDFSYNGISDIQIPVLQQNGVDFYQLAWMRDQVNAQIALLPQPVDTAIPEVPRNSIDSPSVLSQLKKFEPVDISVAGVAAVGTTSIVFAALLAFPTRLMQAGVASNYSRYLARYRLATTRIRSRFDRLFLKAGRLPRSAKLAIGIAAASCISGFLNPGFGLNPESIRVFGSIFLANLIETTMVFGILLLLLKKRGVAATVSLKLGSLIIVLLSVLASRITGFEPGIVFGLVLSLVVLSPGVHKTSLVVLTEWMILVGIGLGTWLMFSAMPPVVAGESNPFVILTSETLSSLTIGALASLPIAMLPFSGLPGKTLADRSWLLWALIYSLSGFMFLAVVMPFPGSFAEVSTPFVAWAGLFAGYALVATCFYLFSAHRAKKRQTELAGFSGITHGR